MNENINYAIDDFTSFKVNLKSLMTSNHVTARTLAKEIGISPVSITRYFSDDRTPDLKYVLRMCDYFNVSVEWLLGITDTNTRKVTPDEDRLLNLYNLSDQRDRELINTILSKYEGQL